MDKNKPNAKRYIVDAGKGKKLVSCPYSCYEDGRDITAYVIPPKGYVLTGFELDTTDTDPYYDGRLIAIYEKATLWELMTSNPMITLSIFAIIIAAIVFFIFHKPKPEPQPILSQNEVVSVVDTISEPAPSTDSEIQPGIQQESAKSTIAAPRSDTATRANTMAFHDRVNSAPKLSESTMRMPSESATPKPNESTMQIQNGSSTPKQMESTMQKQNESTTTPKQTENTMQMQNGSSTTPKQNESLESTLSSSDVDIQFKQEFWSMIHRRSGSMDAYTDLYNKYKGKVKGKEYDYLRGTILKDTPTFKNWYSKLRNVSASDIEDIETISDLIQKLN